MRGKGRLWPRRAACIVLAAAVVAAALLAMPCEVQAAEKVFAEAGKSSVTIKDSESYYSASGKVTGKVVWIKYRAKKNGYLKLSAESNSSRQQWASGYWRLYDKTKKNALSPRMQYDTEYLEPYYYTDYFGVKKGTTYYLAVYAKGGVKITASFTAKADGSGGSSAAAMALNAGGKAAGVMTAGTARSHWYKFTITSRQSFSVKLKAYLTGPVTVTISGNGVKTTEQTVSISRNTWGQTVSWSTGRSVAPGTYYILVKPVGKKCTGYYTVKWQ